LDITIAPVRVRAMLMDDMVKSNGTISARNQSKSAKRNKPTVAGTEHAIAFYR
jgi:hypothetical protein